MKCSKSFICTPQNIWTHLRESHEIEKSEWFLFKMKCKKFPANKRTPGVTSFPWEGGACATFGPLQKTPSKFTCTPRNKTPLLKNMYAPQKASSVKNEQGSKHHTSDMD
jgi:hypothetical protein